MYHICISRPSSSRNQRSQTKVATNRIGLKNEVFFKLWKNLNICLYRLLELPLEKIYENLLFYWAGKFSVSFKRIFARGQAEETESWFRLKIYRIVKFLEHVQYLSAASIISWTYVIAFFFNCFLKLSVSSACTLGVDVWLPGFSQETIWDFHQYSKVGRFLLFLQSNWVGLKSILNVGNSSSRLLSMIIYKARENNNQEAFVRKFWINEQKAVISTPV